MCASTRAGCVRDARTKRRVVPRTRPHVAAGARHLVLGLVGVAVARALLHAVQPRILRGDGSS
eukprot:5358067-Prymnesium_polylepis.1